MKTPEEIAREHVVLAGYQANDSIAIAMAIGAIEADRAQHVGVYVPTTVHEPDALFFREVWIKGESADGTTVEMTRTVGAGGLVLEIDKPDGSRIIESINASEFTQAWAAAAEARA